MSLIMIIITIILSTWQAWWLWLGLIVLPIKTAWWCYRYHCEPLLEGHEGCLGQSEAVDLHFELDLCPADNIFCHPAEQIVSLPTDNIFCHLADIFLLLIIDNSFVIPLIIFFYHPADFTVHCLFLLQRLCIYMLSRLYHRRIHRRTQGRHFHLFSLQTVAVSPLQIRHHFSVTYH